MYEQSMMWQIIVHSYRHISIYLFIFLGRKKLFIDFMSKSEHSNTVHCLFRVELFFFEKPYFISFTFYRN